MPTYRITDTPFAAPYVASLLLDEMDRDSGRIPESQSSPYPKPTRQRLTDMVQQALNSGWKPTLHEISTLACGASHLQTRVVRKMPFRTGHDIHAMLDWIFNDGFMPRSGMGPMPEISPRIKGSVN